MKRITFYISILFLTFIFSIAVTKVYFVWDVQFKSKGVGSSGMCEDGLGGFSVLESYDGEKLNSSDARFPSKETARQCFQLQLQEAVRVVDREVLYDRVREKIVGERVVAVFPPNEFVKSEWALIISIDDDRIYNIASTSLRHAFIYERRIRKY